MRIGTGFVLLVLMGAIASCERTDEVAAEYPGPEYFPLQKGDFLIYDVDSTRIIQNAGATHNFQLRISVVDSFMNGEGNMTFVLQRDKRTDPTKPWVAAGTWSAWKTIRQAVISEGNESFVKLQFPLSKGITWNGNALNANGGEDQCNGTDCDQYEVTETEPEVIVIQSNDTDILVRQDVRKEKYAKNVGLIYKEVTILEYCTSGACFGKQFVDSGIVYKQTLTDSGTL